MVKKASKKRPTLSLFLLVVVALFFLLFNLQKPSSTGPLQKGVFVLSSVVHKTINAVFMFPIELWQRYIYLLHSEEKNRVLLEENKRLRQENILLQEAAIANKRLRELLDYKERTPLNLLAAEVVSIDSSLYFQTAFIDKGERHGITKDLAVIAPGGLVGRVFKTSPSSSMVMLLIDQNFALDVLIQNTRIRAVVEGLGNPCCKLKYLLSSEVVHEGDLVVSSGLEGVFPKGLLVGEVHSVNGETGTVFQDVIVKPVIQFDKLEEVFVVLQ